MTEYPVYKLFTLSDGQTVLRIINHKTEEDRNQFLNRNADYHKIDTIWITDEAPTNT